MPRAERGNAGWATAEILRARAATSDVAADAEALLLRAIELAQQQHALSWELRAETALADLYRRFGRAGMAIERLKSTYARFSEGFDRADLVQARQMMASLETAVPA
jgi:hypothetical protein